MSRVGFWSLVLALFVLGTTAHGARVALGDVGGPSGSGVPLVPFFVWYWSVENGNEEEVSARVQLSPVSLMREREWWRDEPILTFEAVAPVEQRIAAGKGWWEHHVLWARDVMAPGFRYYWQKEGWNLLLGDGLNVSRPAQLTNGYACREAPGDDEEKQEPKIFERAGRGGQGEAPMVFSPTEQDRERLDEIEGETVTAVQRGLVSREMKEGYRPVSLADGRTFHVRPDYEARYRALVRDHAEIRERSQRPATPDEAVNFRVASSRGRTFVTVYRGTETETVEAKVADADMEDYSAYDREVNQAAPLALMGVPTVHNVGHIRVFRPNEADQARIAQMDAAVNEAVADGRLSHERRPGHVRLYLDQTPPSASQGFEVVYVRSDYLTAYQALLEERAAIFRRSLAAADSTLVGHISAMPPRETAIPGGTLLQYFRRPDGTLTRLVMKADGTAYQRILGQQDFSAYSFIPREVMWLVWQE